MIYCASYKCSVRNLKKKLIFYYSYRLSVELNKKKNHVVSSEVHYIIDKQQLVAKDNYQTERCCHEILDYFAFIVCFGVWQQC